MRPGDAGFIAVDANSRPIGAAWYRILPRSDPGFGYVGTGVPELIIGVRPIWRAHGVGRALLQQLCDHARAQGYREAEPQRRAGQLRHDALSQRGIRRDAGRHRQGHDGQAPALTDAGIPVVRMSASRPASG